jgi:hypothetical protein
MALCSWQLAQRVDAAPFSGPKPTHSQLQSGRGFAKRGRRKRGRREDTRGEETSEEDQGRFVSKGGQYRADVAADKGSADVGVDALRQSL